MNLPKSRSCPTGILTALLVCITLLLGACASTDDGTFAAEPTATPAPTQTVPQQVQGLLKHALSTCHLRDVKVQSGAITVDLETCVHAELKDVRSGLLDDIFEVQDALWTSDLHPVSVTVNAYGPLYDKYGNASTGLYASALLTAETAHKFNWKNISLSAAWADYDRAFMRPEIANA